MSTFGLFEIGKTGLLAARKSMDVTGHNIANAATPGYSRQRTQLEPIIQQRGPVTGMGVRVSDIRRIRDTFIDSVLRNESAKKESLSVQNEVLEHLQMIVAEPSSRSVRQAIDDFWASWQDLASDPLSEAARAQVMEKGRSFAHIFRHIGSQIESLTDDIENVITANVQRVNDLSESVASLNAEIIRAAARKEPTLDLMDKRDLILDELAEITGATITHSTDGSVKVDIGGFPLVHGSTSYKLTVTFVGDTEYSWISPGGQPVAMDYMGGKLGGYKTGRDNEVLMFRGELESFLKSIVDDLNNIHANGFPVESQDELLFFTAQEGNYLGSLEVSSEIVSDVRAIRASTVSGDPLDGQNALAIARRLDGSDDPQNPSFIGTWTSMAGKLGTVGQKVVNGVSVQELLVKELQNRKDAVSGVSIDEEVAMLVRHQHCFSAASRVISVADEIIDTIINRLGAGRG
jgi:flagellar hook-associated protein 1 FlgK